MIKLKQILFEIKLIPIIPFKKGELYDLKTWLADHEVDYADGGGGFEPCDETEDGNEGWYWLLGLKFIETKNDKYIFYDTYLWENSEFNIIDYTKQDFRYSKTKKPLNEIKILKDPKEDALNFIKSNFTIEEMLEDSGLSLTHEFDIEDVPWSIVSYLKYKPNLKIYIEEDIIVILYIVNNNLVIEFL